MLVAVNEPAGSPDSADYLFGDVIWSWRQVELLAVVGHAVYMPDVYVMHFSYFQNS